MRGSWSAGDSSKGERMDVQKRQYKSINVPQYFYNHNTLIVGYDMEPKYLMTTRHPSCHQS